MASIFTKIINGELPSYKIYEDETVFAFLALDQVNLGHTLLIPKKETDYWIDVPEKDYLHLQKVALKIGQALQKATDCRKVFQTVVGLEVPHFHLHLIPAWTISDLDFKRAQRHSEGEMKEIQKKIMSHL
jgi:histidine triad (HIT) family protein